MAALTPTNLVEVPMGNYHKEVFFDVVPGSASDTVDLSSYVTALKGVSAVITAGLDAALTMVQASVSGTTLTLATFEQDGTAATDWTSASIFVRAVGTTSS